MQSLALKRYIFYGLLFVLTNLFIRALLGSSNNCDHPLPTKDISNVNLRGNRNLANRLPRETNAVDKMKMPSTIKVGQSKTYTPYISYHRKKLLHLLNQLENNVLDHSFMPYEKGNFQQEIDSRLNDFAPNFCPFCRPRSEKIVDSSHIPEFQADLTTVSEIDDGGVFYDAYFKPRSEVMNTLSYRYKLFNESVCSMPDGKRPFLLVFVPSIDDHVDERQNIRETWGSLAYNNNGTWGNFAVKETMRLIFLVGNVSVLYNYDNEWQQLLKESRNYGDIVMADFEESYKNLSRKIPIGLEWIRKHCDGVRHVLKIDEDTFVHIPKLMSLLTDVEKRYKTFVLGRAHSQSRPPVMREGKWAVGDAYPMGVFPRYVIGASYVVSGPAIKRILHAFTHMPWIPNEDAFVTGILSKAAKVTRLACPLFGVPTEESMICRLARGFVVSSTNCTEDANQAILDDVERGFCDWRLQSDAGVF